MTPPNQLATVTIESPPATKFDIALFIDDHSPNAFSDPTVKDENRTEFLFWLDSIPLHISLSEPFRERYAESIQVRTFKPTISEKELSSLFWKEIPDYIEIQDEDQIQQELNAITPTLQPIETSIEAAETLTIDIEETLHKIEAHTETEHSFLELIGHATETIDSLLEILQNSKEQLELVEAKTEEHSIAATTYNSEIQALSQTTQTTVDKSESLRDNIRSLTPDSVSRQANTAETMLETIDRLLTEIQTTIQSLLNTHHKENDTTQSGGA